jgi:hypothetical protein
MIKAMSGIMEGVSLSYLASGLTYDMHAALARYLVTCGAAEEVDSTEPGLILSLNDPSIAHLTGGVTVTGANLSADESADRKPVTVRPFPKRN